MKLGGRSDSKHPKPDILQYALHLISRAEQFSAGLLLKLQKKGYSRADAEAVIGELSVTGMLDDARYARLWLGLRIKHRSASPRELLSAICGKGLKRDIASAALKEALDECGDTAGSHELALLRRFIAKNGLGELTAANLRKRLRFEGFSPEVLDCLADE
ncbi:MAG: RecX family transcriptional regulator [Spirochaetaceae bacterium]|jgi:SOS response regulatory protein OraA/RecX|nr:RecX family transcriptional regulator [Spirochaetaceae bacterium]